MFHVPVRVLPRILRGSAFVLLKKRGLHPEACGLRYLTTSPDIASLKIEVRDATPSALSDLWNRSIEADRDHTLSARYEFYKRVRDEGMSSTQFYWCTSIIGCLPLHAIRYADLLFAVELLASLKLWSELHSLLLDLSRSTPVYWEQLMLNVLKKSSPDLPAIESLEMFGECCANRDIDISKLERDDLPLLQMCSAILIRFSSATILEALESIASYNVVLANQLSSALSRARSGFLLNPDRAPSPTSSIASNEIVRENVQLDITETLWKWKMRRNLASAEDLRIYMLHLIYNERSNEALQAYDDNVSLHRKLNFSETVLLAAAGAHNYSRLQSVFEEVEQNPASIEELGSRRYAIVLGALGYLGDVGIVGDIYNNILKSRPEFLTRAVYHALIYSHSVRGDTKAARKVYDTMVGRGVAPNYTTFGLMLGLYRNSLDLKTALTFVGDEMVSRHQHALRNQELTMLLSLCGKRRDHKSAKYVWEWGNSILTPDRVTYNTYLHVLLSANDFDNAGNLFEEIENRFDLGIDTLTIMLNAAGRSKNIDQFISNIIAKKRDLQLESDEAWYVSLLSALAEIGNLDQFEKNFKKMKEEGLTPTGSHYALYMSLLAKSKHFAREDKYSQEMRDAGVPINFAFIEQQLRLLVAPGSSQDSRQSAHAAALTLVRDGYFDPSAAMIPRGIIPVRVVEPVVSRLVKLGQYVSAKQLLDGLRKQRVEESSMKDEFEIWALYMMIAERSQNHTVINQLWTQLKTVLPNVYVLSEPAIFSNTGVTNSESKPNLTKKPVFKIAARYRKTLSKTVDIWIRQLERTADRQALLNLSKEMETMGLALSSSNVNTYIIALVKVGEVQLAFHTANATRSIMPYNWSSRCKAALTSVVDQVDYRKYGRLGYIIHCASRWPR